MRVSNRAEVDAFMVMDVLEAARRYEAEGRSIIHMEIGQPATPAPRSARSALASAMATDALGYSVALGLPALRARIARHYADWYAVEVDPDRVIVTAGASAGLMLAFLALFEAGDRVALGNPGYPSYRNILHALDLVPDLVETTVETRFQPTPALLARHAFAGLLVASPANPSGTMLDETALSAIAQTCRDRHVPLISDEIYHGIHYGQNRPVTALSVDRDAIVINSFSKYFSMTGWRIGWMVVPEDLIRPVERLAQNLFICAAHASQIAALGAFDGMQECEGHVATYAANRAMLLDGLAEAGFTRLAPCDGAFYLYADLEGLSDDSRRFAADLLEQAGVAATPGHDFDPVRGHRFLRFSFAGATEDMAEGVRRIKAWMAAR